MAQANRNPLDTRVVVTGLGTVNPLGDNVRTFWDSLVKGANGIDLVHDIDIDDYFIKIAGQVKLPDITDYFKEKKMARRLDRYIVLGHIAGTQALRDSGLDVNASPHRYGSLIGTGDGGVETNLENVGKIVTRGMHTTSPFYIINSIPNSGSGFFAQSWNLQGPCFSVNSACATSNHAIGLAAMMIKMGMADAVLSGGAEAPVNKSGLCAFGNIYALSERNDDPATASRPFDVDRDGFVLSEGAGVLCLEELEHARARDAKIYCEVTGFGFSCDAHDLVAPHPDGRGAGQAMDAALKSARLAPSDIDLINAHATSTSLGDPIEFSAAARVFGEYARTVPVHSTKSMTGHLLGAAGAVEAIAAILAFEEGVMHETTNQFQQDPKIGFNVIKGGPREQRPTHILSNGFGFGGQNAAVVLSSFNG